MPISQRLLAMTLMAVFLSSCGPTYPKEKVVESVIRLAAQEYVVPIQAVLNGTTLGVLIPVRGLFDNLPPEADESQIELAAQNPQFSKEGLEAIEDVSLAMRRVALSTDAKIDFYTLVARDEATHLEFAWSGSVTDLKRVSYLDISQGDFLKYRTPVSLRLAPVRAAARTVENFLADLRNKPAGQILKRYVAPGARVNEILPTLFLLLAEVPEVENLKQAQLAAVQISPQEVLVHAQFKKENQTVAYLFELSTSEFRGMIRGIIRVSAPGALPKAYRSWGDPSGWAGLFHVEAIQLPQFLADQIARRSRLDLVSAGDRYQPFELAVEGSFEQSSFRFRFHYLGFLRELAREQEREITPAEDHSDELAAAIVQTAAQVLHSYRFSDFEALTVTDGLRGTRWEVSAKELPFFRRRIHPALSPLP